MRHKYLTPWQALGYTLQWWDNLSTLDKSGEYRVRLECDMRHHYCVLIDAPWDCTFVIHVDTQLGGMSVFRPSQYHYHQYKLGLYKREDLRAIFLWARRVMEHSPVI